MLGHNVPLLTLFLIVAITSATSSSGLTPALDIVKRADVDTIAYVNPGPDAKISQINGVEKDIKTPDRAEIGWTKKSLDESSKKFEEQPFVWETFEERTENLLWTMACTVTIDPKWRGEVTWDLSQDTPFAMAVGEVPDDNKATISCTKDKCKGGDNLKDCDGVLPPEFDTFVTAE